MDKQPNAKCKIFPLSHLGIIAVTGEDNAKFLQGQLSCDIHSLSEARATIAAFCNPKGRVISTLIVTKSADTFLLILPSSLLDIVLKKLQIYILRSAVRLSDQSASLRLFGLACPPSAASELKLPTEAFTVSSNDATFIRLPSSMPRFLCIAESATALQHGFDTGEAEEWLYQDLSTGFPWFEAEQSEQYIPQMLNIDALGGISFNKGCYTGQEIIARTHYLGKAKRNLFVAECSGVIETPNGTSTVLDSGTMQNVGHVIAIRSYAQNTRMLLVIAVEDADSKHLILDDGKQTAVKILSIP